MRIFARIGFHHHQKEVNLEMKDFGLKSNFLCAYPIDRTTARLWCFVTTAVVVFVVGVLSEIAIRQPLKISPDPAFFMAIGQLILEGKVPYVDLFDVNPPLVLYLHTIPAMVARFLPIPTSESFNFFVIGSFVLSTLLSSIIFWRRRHHAESFLFCPLLIGFTLATFLFGTRLNDFGQREHLFVLAYLPFFLIRWLKWTMRPVASLEAIFATVPLAITVLLKPHFVFVVLFTELSMFLQTFFAKQRVFASYRKPEIGVLLSAAAIYGLYFCFMPEEARHGYFDFIIPSYSLGYDAFVSSTPTLIAGALLQFKFSVYVCVTALIGAHILQGRSTLLIPLAGLTTASYAIYIVQGNAWINRAIPFFTGGFMLASIEIGILLYLVASFAAKMSITCHRVLAALVGVALVSAIGQEQSIQRLISNDPQPFLLSRIGLKGSCAHFGLLAVHEPILQETTEHDTILFISPFIAPGYPTLLQLNRRPASRYLHGMLIPVLLHGIKSTDNRKQEFAKSMLERATREYSDDIKKNKPKLIFVQKKLMAPFIESNPVILDALSAYEKTSEIEAHDVYRLR